MLMSMSATMLQRELCNIVNIDRQLCDNGNWTFVYVQSAVCRGSASGRRRASLPGGEAHCAQGREHWARVCQAQTTALHHPAIIRYETTGTSVRAGQSRGALIQVYRRRGTPRDIGERKSTPARCGLHTLFNKAPVVLPIDYH